MHRLKPIKMIALPLSILALAAGVYLLIKVNREYLGGLFKFFAWLIILLSLVSTGVVIRHGIHHFRSECCKKERCEMKEQVIIKELHGMPGDSVCPMSGCKMMGDSVVLDHAMCEKMMGKDGCEKMCKERGQCVMTKDECAKMCGGMSKCSGEAKEGCKGEGKEMKACCKGEAGEKKACCKGEEKEPKACCKK